MIRALAGGVALLGLLAGCDPAGPAGGGLFPAPGGPEPTEAASGGAPLDAMRPDASPMASSAAMTVDATGTDAQTAGGPGGETAPAGDADALAAAATAAVADGPSPTTPLEADGGALASYARATSHPVGQSMHARDFASPERAERACARYVSADQAQSVFLASGGPEQDPRGLDPDGDGYACGWDPAGFRSDGAG
jgi:hypothetical protein